MIGSQIAELAGDLPKYATTVETKVATVRSCMVGRLAHVADMIGPHKVRQGSDQTAVATGEPGDSALPTAAPAPSVPAAPAAGSSPLELARTYLSPLRRSASSS